MINLIDLIFNYFLTNLYSIFLGNNIFTIVTTDLLFILFQIFILYLLIQIFYELNVLRLVLNLLILLLLLAGILMLFQFELFACFLIVSEILLFAFIYAYLYNLNLMYKNTSNHYTNYNIYNFLIISCILIIYIFANNWIILLTNLNDLYVYFQKTIQLYTNITFSDLIFLFNFFFIYNTMLYSLLILILFIMTFIIIYATFLVYLLNINIYQYNLLTLMSSIDSPNFNATLLLKKKKKIKKLRIFKIR